MSTIGSGFVPTVSAVEVTKIGSIYIKFDPIYWPDVVSSADIIFPAAMERRDILIERAREQYDE